MNKLRVADAITEIFNIFRRSNKYIDETTPWTLAKDEAKKDRLATVLYNLTEAITIGASLLFSFMPETSRRSLAQLNTEEEIAGEHEYLRPVPEWKQGYRDRRSCFARMDIKDVMEKVEATKAAAAAEKITGREEGKKEAGMDVEKKPEITYDDFAKASVQIGES